MPFLVINDRNETLTVPTYYKVADVLSLYGASSVSENNVILPPEHALEFNKVYNVIIPSLLLQPPPPPLFSLETREERLARQQKEAAAPRVTVKCTRLSAMNNLDPRYDPSLCHTVLDLNCLIIAWQI